MFKKKLVVGVSVCFLVLCLLVVPVFAVEHIWYTNPEANFAQHSTNAFAGTIYAYGMRVTGNDEYLTKAIFYFSNSTASAIHTLIVKVWNATGTSYNTTVDYSGNVMVESYPVTLTITEDHTPITFTFATPYLLDSDMQYIIGFRDNGTMTGTVEFDQDSTSLGYYENSDVWALGSAGMLYAFYTNPVWGASGGDGSGGGTGGGAPTTGLTFDQLTGGVVNWIIYLVVMLLPAWFLGMFLKMGKWGFVIGLAIGSGLGYAFISGFPLWLLMLVVIGEVGLAYQSISQGG